ncbi:MAG TPA: tRNA-dihydrouridine synthase [Candidatus Polarisedimenticolaceae bacterium]|nr:tRNA-dihydrouridine synthase [Candidatus Polarisedimenticolaceae bacterium]
MNTIWHKLHQAHKPFFIFAPMDDVTDTVFREVVARAGKPDLSVTEFASSDGFAHPKGRHSVEQRLRINPSEAALGVPLIAQIWGNNPEHYYEMAQDLAGREQFAGIDINMGCPEKGIVKRGCCGGLIKAENWDNAAAIVQATKAGAGDLPISVKTRIGVGEIITEEWISHLLTQNIAALTVHGRTVREMSRVPAHWEEIGKVAKLRDQLAPQTLVIGNGDVMSREQGEQLAAKYGLDGIMIGRGIFQNPFLFAPAQNNHTPEEMFAMLLQHTELYESTWGETKSYNPLKRFFKIYVNGFPGAAELRAQLMDTKNAGEAREVMSKTSIASINV